MQSILVPTTVLLTLALVLPQAAASPLTSGVIPEPDEDGCYVERTEESHNSNSGYTSTTTTKTCALREEGGTYCALYYRQETITSVKQPDGNWTTTRSHREDTGHCVTPPPIGS